MYETKAKEIVKTLTLEEKASLTSGAEMFATSCLEEKGIASVFMSDGPHGLRKQEGKQDFMGKNESVTATCFPAACCVASSFDVEVAEKLGRGLAKNCQAESVDVLLGPGINIKRSPLCGRNFEYFSEDPYLAGSMGSAYVKALQAEGIGASLKHYVANNQETRRRTSNSKVSERAMREIYLSAFEKVVKEAKPWTVMASYNKVEGTYLTENRKYLVDILRKEWGFDGMVVSDWAAVHDRIAAVKGGCALTMPGDSLHDHVIVDAVKSGALEERLLDEACEQIVALSLKAQANRKKTSYDMEEGHRLAVELAKESLVLLKNEGDLLPLDADKKVLVVGAFAEEARYQGAGSSHVNAYKVPTLQEVVGNCPNVSFVEGFGMEDSYDEKKAQEAVNAAKKADVVVVMAGLPPIMESEGFDRYTMKLPRCQNRLITELASVQKNITVVLENGGVVEMPWADEVPAIVEAYLVGEGVNEAIWSVLTGQTNPSGHLAESFPLCYEDSSAYLTWPGEGNEVTYGEDIFVGYRYYSSRKQRVRFPFGHGLSYTTFSYRDLFVERNRYVAGQTLEARVTVENTGKRAGKALVQLYVGCKKGATAINRPVRELRRFEKVSLQPGESKTVIFTLDQRCFSYWDKGAHAFRVPGGDYTIEICQDAATVLLQQEITVEDEYIASGQKYDLMTPIVDVQKHPLGKAFMEEVQPMIDAVIARMDMGKASAQMPYAEEMPKELGLLSEPLQTIKRMLPMLPEERWENLFQEMNEE